MVAFLAMAGFGILMAYLFYTVAGIVLACFLALILFLVGRKIAPRGTEGREAFLSSCWKAPFLGLLWILFAFIAYSCIMGLVFHRDNGLSANPHAPLPDGYILGAAHYGNNYIIGPGKLTNGCSQDGPDCVAGVLYLQIADPYLLGSKFRGRAEGEEYFLIDTRARIVLKFATIKELRVATAARGVAVSFGENWIGGWQEAYLEYRPIWFDWFFPLFSIAGLAASLASLTVKAKRLRQRALQDHD